MNELRTMHLFAGGGGGLYADLILGHKPIVAVECDPYACAVLRSRAEDGWFPGLRVWEGDVRLFDPSEYTGKVDCIHAGFPCTDISTAGRGEGINGERSGLYREILRISDVVRPRFLFLENSPAITCRGLGQVLGELSERGYNAKWTVLSAGEVGANHKRERWWCICERNVSNSEMSRNRGGVGNVCKTDGRQDGKLFQQFIQPSESVSDAEFDGGKNEKQTSGEVEFLGTPDSDTTRDNTGDKGQGGRETKEPRQSPILGGIKNPGDAIPNPDGAFVSFDKCAQRGPTEPADLIINSWWKVEPDVGRLAHGVALGSYQIKCLGNGQVPICAAAAWKILTEY